MQHRRLKAGTVYVHRITGDLALLRRGTGLFRLKKQWELDKHVSVMPEELNPDFRKILKRNYRPIGEL